MSGPLTSEEVAKHNTRVMENLSPRARLVAQASLACGTMPADAAACCFLSSAEALAIYDRILRSIDELRALAMAARENTVLSLKVEAMIEQIDETLQ